jgi:hypothetical protein
MAVRRKSRGAAAGALYLMAQSRVFCRRGAMNDGGDGRGRLLASLCNAPMVMLRVSRDGRQIEAQIWTNVRDRTYFEVPAAWCPAQTRHDNGARAPGTTIVISPGIAFGARAAL